MNIEKIARKGKPTVEKRTKQDGSISYRYTGYYLGIDEVTRKKVNATITGQTLKELDRNMIKARLDFERNGHTKKEQLQITLFSELAEEWFVSYKLITSSENTNNRVRGYLDTYIIPRFGDYLPDKIKPIDVQTWVNECAAKARQVAAEGRRAKKGEAKDFGAALYKLRDIFDYGITNFGLKKNPATTVQVPPKPKENKVKVKVLHDDELKIWLKHLSSLPNNQANRRFKLICETLLASGIRINELLALTIDDLNFETSELDINKTLMWKAADKKTGIKGKVICKPSPKSDAGCRKVDVPPKILERLKAWHDEVSERFEKIGLDKPSLIFPTVYGAYMCDRNERTTLKKQLTACGLPLYGFHIFRHTHASLLLNAGTNWKELQVRMGHKSIATTMDLYAELAPKKKAEAVNIYLDKIDELTA